MKWERIILLVMLFTFTVAANDKFECIDTCTFIIKNEQDNSYQITNKERANKRLTPFSTFKIPNSLIALDLGLIKDMKQPLTFDKSTYPVKKWWPKIWYNTPIDLKTAYKYSAVPIYQHIASQIGHKQMNEYLSKFDYGNQDISSGIDTFWLNGSIKITAKEQVDFLQKLYNKKLPLLDQSFKMLKEIMLVKSTDKYKLYAKTGTGPLDKDKPSGKALGWYVGFVENEKGVYYFALNMEGKTFADVKKLRIKTAEKQLRKAGII